MTFLRINAANTLKRSFASPTAIRPTRLSKRSTCPAWQAPNLAVRSISSTKIREKKVEFTQKQEAEAATPTKDDNRAQDRKVPRKNAAKTSSLRRVAVEAQRSRGIVRGKGNKRFVDPDAETKNVTAYCAAEQYSISAAARLIRAQGYEIDPLQTGLYPQVIHITTTERPSEVKDFQSGDIFIFPSGTVVTWNVREREALHLVNKILPAAAEGSHLDLLETEDLDYLEDPSSESSEIIGDTIILGTRAEANIPESNENVSEETDQRHEVDTVLAKIAFSSGLARSTKLAVLESLLSAYQDSTRLIPTMLAKGESISLGRKNVPFTRSFILRKTGELLSIRAQLNLYSELTDSMPDIFWDSRHELGLGEYYDQVGRALDVGVRIKVLNEKIGFAQEIASVLRESLSEKHGLRLEWAIIALIAVEVVLEFYRHWKDSEERDDPQSTESLLRQYLQRVTQETK
ncbi:DUF155-domain-containing protein [Aaosphaeria arxii CBS 175.79]|uniref:DUF155-domain-containing protein n=1 Tax=Aaosphaeria arxii CBS 175.79 TaxID=1450172 RepID=A0A6A5XZD7_9PLEO|nr:DUF155-domain-containing protein [Aaosphaeria arxii CBS 175.79]KAF2018336.1 DUF155-domain-containing protein [Aaosphaeria arxii CBS 175.79]